jgi:hypothetical protein
MTQDVYMGRKVRNPAAAEALERAFEDPGSTEVRLFCHQLRPRH